MMSWRSDSNVQLYLQGPADSVVQKRLNNKARRGI